MSRLTRVSIAVLSGLSVSVLPGTVRSFTNTYLACDTAVFRSLTGVTATVNPPEPLGPVLEPEFPWEIGTLSYFCVMEDQGLYKMWYGSYEAGLADRWICYATSIDGLNWTKPALGIVEYQGSHENNLLPIDFSDGGAVFIDPLAPAESRYKILGQSPLPLIYESPDGINFVQVGDTLLDLLADSHNQLFYDDRRGTYTAYLRSWNYRPENDSVAVPVRTVSRLEIADPTLPWPYTPLDSPLYLWGSGKPPCISTEFDVVMAPDSLDPLDIDIYNPCVNQYLEAADAYFAFPSIYHHWPPPPEGKFYNDGILHIQVAFSRDGINWIRYRAPYVDNNCCGDSLLAMYMASGMLRIGNYYYQYFNGLKESHGDTLHTSKYFGMRQRIDGFVSLDAANDWGIASTNTLVFEGNMLLMNYQAETDGSVLVELQDGNGIPIAGHALADADTLRGDRLSGPVSWGGHLDLSSLDGTSTRIRVAMKNARLFSFRFDFDPSLDIDDTELPASTFSLHQNYPNPFNSQTQIRFDLVRSTHVELALYNVLGERVRVLVNGPMPPGSHSVNWDGCDQAGRSLAASVYFYRLTAGDESKTLKMVLLK